MSIHFLSFEFFEALGACEGRGKGLVGVDDFETLFSINIGDNVFTVELEGTDYVGFSRGGNPNDMDFQLSAPEEVWRELFRSGAGGDLGSWVQETGRIALDTMDADGVVSFRRALPLIEDLFGRADQLDVEMA